MKNIKSIIVSRDGGSKSKIVQLALLLLFAVFVTSSAFAANPVYTYTATTGGSAPATDGAGAWSASSANWLLNNAGTAVNWPNTSATDASIGNAGAGGTITLGTGISCGNLTFNSVSSPYTLSSGTLSLNGNLTANNSATISSLTLNGGSIWTVAGGDTLSVSSFTRSAGATLVVGSSSVAAASQGTVTCSLTLVNGVVPWAAALSSGTAANDTAAGYNFATTSGNIVAYTSATSETGTGSWSGIPSGGTGTVNYDLSGTGSYSATGLVRDVNTIRFTGTAAATQTDNTSNEGLMQINCLMNAGGGLFTIGGGTKSLGIEIGANNELVLAAMTGGITLNNGIENDGANASGLTIMGDGGNVVTLTESGTGTTYNYIYTGATTIAPGGTLTMSSTATLDAGSYSAAIVNNGTFNYNGTAAQTLSGVISGSGALTKNSTSILTLSGANTYTGNTTISSGTLNANNTSGSATGTGTVTVNSGGQLVGIGTISGAVTISSGGVLAPGSGGVGTITVGSLTMNAGATNNFEFNGSANDQTVVTTSGGLVLNGGVFNLYQPGGTTTYATVGTYNLIQYSGSISGTATSGGNLDSTWTTVSGGNPHVGNPQAGYVYQFGTSGGWLTVTIAVGGTVGSWDVDASGNWSASGNWTGGSVPGANTGISGDTATFAGVTTTAARTVTLDAAEAVGAITMNQAQSFTIANAGHTLTLDNKGVGAAVTVSAGTANAIGTAVALKDNTTVTVSSGQSLGISGNIANSSGAKTLTLNGAGTNILSGANSYGPSAGSVGTTLSGGGTLQVGNNSALGAGDLSVSGNNTLQAGASVSLANNIAVGSGTATVDNNGNNLTLSGIISGGGNLSEIGTGTLTLSGNESFTGTLTANAGTLALSGTSASTSTTIGASGTLQLQANSGNTSAGVSSVMADQNIPTAQLASGATIQLRADSTVASGGVVSFDSGATLIGTTTAGQHLNGTYNFDVNNISTGTGIILYFGPQNTLSSTTGWYVGNASATPTFNVTGGNGYSLEINGLWVGNNDTVVLNPTTANLIIAQGIGNGSTGGVTKNGAGTLTLTGASTSTGATTINAGTLQLGDGGSLSPSSAIIDNGTFAINESGAVVQGTAFSTAAITGTGGLTQLGAGTTTLNAANTYSGGTVLQAGTLQVSGINNVGGASYGGVTFNGGTLQYAASASGAGSLDFSSGNSITLSSGGGTFDVNGNTVTYAGSIGHSGSGALTVQDTAGGGVLKLNGANTYTNVTTVNSGATIGGTGSLAGALTLSSGANALMTANSPLTVAGAVTLNGNTFTTTAPLTSGTYTLLTGGSIAGGSTVNATPGAGSLAGGYNGVVSISGNSVILTVTSTGTAATWTDGNMDQNWSEAGNWSGGVPHVAGDTATFNSAGGSAVTLNANETVAGITLNNPSSDVISGGNTLTLDGTGSGASITVSAGTANAINASIALNDNTAIIANSGKSLTLGGTVANSSGSETLTIAGGGTAILSQANSYGPSAGSVGTTVGGATTVQVGNNTALGAGDVGVSGNSTIQAGAAGLSLANNIAMADATTVDNNGNDLGLSGVISGGGALTKIGNGMLTLSGVNTRSGAMTISAGTLVVGDPGQLGGGAYAANILNNGTLAYNSSAAQTLSGIISGSGTLNENSSSGTLTLSSANTFTNTTTLTAGTLTLANQNALQNSTLNYNGGSLTFSGITAATLGSLSGTANLSLANAALAPVTVTVGGNNSTTAYSGVLSDYNGAFGPGSLTKNGTGTLTLSGNESNTGTNRINAGTLVLSGDNSGRPTASANRTVVNNGGTLQLQANGGNTSGGTSTALSAETTANGPLTLNPGSTLQLRGDSSVTFAGGNTLGGLGGATVTLDVNQLTSAGTNNTLTFAPGGFYTYITVINVTGGNGYTLALGPILGGGNGTLTLNANSANLLVNGGIPGINGNLTFGGGFNSTVTGAIANGSSAASLIKNGAGTLTLSGNNTYTGATTISTGTLQADGSIGASAVAVNGGTLDGVGSIAGTVNVASAGNLGAGDAGTNVGTLTINNNLTLQGNATLRVSKTGSSLTNDQVAVNGNITYAGILTVTNITSDLTMMTTTDTFQIFSVSGSPSGNFTNIVGSPGAGLAYSFNPTNGVLSVVSAVAPLSGLKFTARPVISGTSLTISGTNSGAGTVYLLTSTNVAASLSTWTPVWTNVLSGSGSFTTNLSNVVNPALKQQFYILSNTNN